MNHCDYQVTFHPLYFTAGDFGASNEKMNEEPLKELGDSQLFDDSRKGTSAFLLSLLKDDDSWQDTISTTTTNTNTSTSRASSNPMKRRTQEKCFAWKDDYTPQECNVDLTFDNDAMDIDHIKCQSESKGTTSARRYKMYSNSASSSSFLVDDTFTIYKEPSPPFLSQSDEAKAIHMEKPSSCSFLNHVHTNMVNLSGSFIFLPPPSPILKRKSRSLSRSSPQQSILLHDTIHDVKQAREKANKMAFQMKIRLRNAEAQLKALQIQLLVQDKKNRDEFQTFLLDYFPDQPVNYSHFVGPPKSHLVDSMNQIGSYSIGKCLGQGGFAQVLQCTDRFTNRKYAMKKFEKSKMLTRHTLSSLSNELRVLKQARHANVITSTEVLNGKTHIYVVMELGHTSLYSYYMQYALELTTSVHREIAIGILQGLEYLHSIGVAHLDLKLENILVKSDLLPCHFTSRNILLADFGLCSIADEPMDPIYVSGKLGTLGFFAPEMKLVGISEGRKADMWSVGVTLLELVEGLPIIWMDAYSEEDDDKFRAELEDCMMVVADRGYFADHLAHDLVLDMLHWNPIDRPTCQEALDHVFLKRRCDMDDPTRHGL